MSNNVIIRTAKVEDLPAMLALWRQLWEPQDYEANLKTKLERDPDLNLVAEKGGKIVGTAIGGFDLWWAWIYRVAVDKDCRRQGLGKALLLELGKRFKSKGINSAGMIISPENQAMLALVKSLGGRTTFKYGMYGMRFP